MTDQNSGWHPVTKGLHWLFVILLLCVWGAVELHEFYDREDPMRGWLVRLHFSLGITVLLLLVLRLYWRARHKRPQVEGPGWQRALSSLLHGALYLVLLVMPLSGISMRQLFGRDTEFFGLFALPRLLEKNPDLGKQIAFLHKEVFWPALLILVGLHIAAALWHHFVQKDNTLTRMLPQR
ncbi:cytochrome b [Microbulbifer thermotolerans]|uniref:cytochrome b n=2 Tax=Microbulbifer thermotolerans TaxID=252514 RepID=UPI0008EF4D15|nr:cytochrome b [Microbulbifer thermotolerans]MCX2781147.1 cytochrome b [Microbulbifer thermotolerans]MCX2784437.1 cytochrome b [Microbulbifer thermotolerans]MCX2804608.1 cytochrome b [Microbulbifer thermotolerans]MCX2831513.1 cytochrome b [Microbulbifer thermotolerans]MCX2842902.1 cytochrome b [Microbulbifer thermotolerans]